MLLKNLNELEIWCGQQGHGQSWKQTKAAQGPLFYLERNTTASVESLYTFQMIWDREAC